MSADSLIRRTPICVLWTKTWAGNLGHTVLYRQRRLDDHRLLVGYFVYWTTERAWGDNNLTRWFLPALAIDGVYSHLLFVLPGIQRAMYGAGDIEGVCVTFKLGRDGRIKPEALVADNDSHEEVQLTLDEAVDESGRIFVHNDVWSHQLGGRDALHKARSGATYRCFSDDTLVPLSEKVASDFRLGSTNDPRRAGPAWRDEP